METLVNLAWRVVTQGSCGRAQMIAGDAQLALLAGAPPLAG
jgi:hypothetical protein